MVNTRAEHGKTEDNANALRRLTAKKAASIAMAQTVAETDKKREKDKKQRAKEKAEEEAKEKALRDEERRKKSDATNKKNPASKEDIPTEEINSFLTALSTFPEGEDGVEDIPVINLREEEDSPEKKKVKHPAIQKPGGALKTSRYGKRQTPAAAPPVVRPVHNHAHRRIIFDAAIELNKDDPIASFVSGLVLLFNNAKMVDEHFLICPLTEGDKAAPWYSAGDIPNNMTAVSTHISISANNIRMFEKRKDVGGYKKKNKDEKDTSVVYFSFAISCDIDPATLIARVGIEWTRAGGIRLMVKALPCFETISPLVVYYLFNECHPATILEEWKKILLLTKTMCAADINVSDTALSKELPAMAFRKMIPKVPGQDTSSLQHLSSRAQFARRAWHLEVETAEAGWIKELVEKAKYYGCIEAFWGKHALVTEIATRETSAVDLKRLALTVNRHTNYQCSLTVEQLRGVVDVDYPAKYPIQMPDGATSEAEVTLREVLLKQFRMSDGHALIAEVHQRVVTSPVEIVIPATAEAETMLAKMNKQAPAFFYYYLQDRGLSKEFVIALVRNSCCPTLVVEIPDCKWDGEQMMVTTKSDAQEQEIYTQLETASWFKDEIGLGKKKKQNYVDPTLLYDLDGDRSIKTLHERNDKVRTYGDAPSGEGKDLIDVDEDMDSASDSDISKSHPTTALGMAKDSNRRVSFTAGSSGEFPSPEDAAGGG